MRAGTAGSTLLAFVSVLALLGATRAPASVPPPDSPLDRRAALTHSQADRKSVV